jgi:hypothetical protein
MIIEMYALLFALSVAFIIIGYQYDSEILRMIGFTMIFICGVLVITDDISYVSGSNVVEINTSTTVITKNYTLYENTSLGVMLATIGAVSFFLTLFELRNSFRSGGG